MLKRICSMLIVLCMVFSTVGAFAYTDVEAGKETTAVELVTGLGIMSPADDSEFGVKTLVKRGEFALYITKLMDYNVTVHANSNGGYFDDVDLTTLEGSAVEHLAGLGIIPKSGNEYNPNDEITYVEAVRVLLNAMGYERVASMNGGFPGGYLKTATECDLNKNVWKLTNSVLTKADAATLIYNALFVHPMETDYNNTYAESDKTLLESTRDVFETIGVVAGYENSCLAAGKSLPENSVEINGAVYDAGTTNIGDYIGYAVYAYYEEARDGSRTLVAFAEKPNTNKVVKLSLGDIEIDGDRVTYYEGTTKKKLKFSESAAVLYNGGYYSEYESVESFLENIPEGEVTFISNDGTDVSKILVVNSYKHLLVERVDSRGGRLYLKNGSPTPSEGQLGNVVEVSTTDIEATVYLDGKQIGFDEILPDDAITMVQSLDGSKVVLQVSRKTVEGSISSIDDDEIGISGTKYPISKYCINTYSAGTKGTFAITADGKFIGLTSGSKANSSNYAYVLDVYCEKGPDKAYVELYTPNGEVKEYVCDSNIKINGKKITFDEVPNKVFKSEIVTFRTKADGSISQINRPFDASTKLNYVNETEFIKNWNKSSVRYTDGIMGMSFITDETLIFSMPRFDKGNVSDYKILSVDDLKNRTYADVTCYDVDRQGRAGVLLIVEDPADSVDMGDALFFVKELSYTVNDDDEDICRITGYQGGEEVTLDFTADTQSVTYEDGWMNYVGNEDFDTGYLNLHAGDAIQYSLDNEGCVAAYRLVFNNENTIYTPDGELVYSDSNNFFEDWSQTGSVTKQDFHDDLYIAFGDVQRRYMDYILLLGLNQRDRLVYEDSASPIRIIDYYRPINLLNASVYVYNVRNGELELGDMEDVMETDVVFVRSQNMGEMNEIMVYVEE